MDKPRICEILGLEVGEIFNIEGSDNDYYIRENGMFSVFGNDFDSMCDAFLADIIQNPSRIKRKTALSRLLSDEEIAWLRFTGADWVSRDEDSDSIDLWKGAPPDKSKIFNKMYYSKNMLTNMIGHFQSNILPNIPKGYLVKVPY